MAPKRSTVKSNSSPTSGNASVSKGTINWETSTRTYELRREKVEFNLDETVIEKLGDFQKFLIETKVKKNPHQSGILEEILISHFKLDPNYQTWVKARDKKAEDEAAQKTANELEKEDDALLENIGKNPPAPVQTNKPITPGQTNQANQANPANQPKAGVGAVTQS